MKNILFKILMASVLLLASFFYNQVIVFAYDIPKVITEEILNDNVPNKNNESDNKTDSPILDNNYIFVGCYKNLNFYLDIYSIKIKKNSPNKRTWSQFIFPIGSNVTSKNSKSQKQIFHFDGKNAYNSRHKNNLIDEISDENDKVFIKNCFKVGYHYAFNKKN